jgi:predicted methyltransferase
MSHPPLRFDSRSPLLRWPRSHAVALWACTGALALALGAGAAQSAPPTKREPAGVMSYEGAAWLERAGRDQQEKPEVVLAAMQLREGMTVAEIGAGTGYFSRRLGKAVGPTGKVYAEDIQPQMLDLLKGYVAKAGVHNVTTVLGTDTDPKLPPHAVDRILLVDVYHEFQKPQEMLARIAESLAPGGRVILVEYRLEGTTAAHINIKHRMSIEQVVSEWTAAGFQLLDRIESLPAQRIFIFSAHEQAAAPAAKPPAL